MKLKNNKNKTKSLPCKKKKKKCTERKVLSERGWGRGSGPPNRGAGCSANQGIAGPVTTLP